MSDIWVFQHLEAEPPALIQTVLEGEGHQVRVFHTDLGECPAELTPDCGGLVVMGGPMAVYQPGRNPWMPQERKMIERALTADMPILGMCLGAQFLAQAAGANVYAGKRAKEIGWGTVTMTQAGQTDPLAGHLADLSGDAETTVFQWHGDTFDLPKGAAHLASSPLYPNQAFRVGRAAYGFQFHFEVTDDIIRDWVQRWEDEVREQKLDPNAILAGIPKHLADLQARGTEAIRAWSALVGHATQAIPLRSAARAR